MSYEIKEIFDLFKSLNSVQIDKLLDYITNLLEEIERQSKAQVILDNQITEMYDYKLRNEKALFYLANCDWNKKEFVELYDILQGDVKK